MLLSKKAANRHWLMDCIIVAAVIFALLQIKRPDVTHPPVTGDLKAPTDVEAIMRRACYDCHYNETNLRWYDQIAPVSWQVAEHIKDGRTVLNFSEWDKLAPAEQKAKLWECINQVNAGAMPIRDYEMVHPSAKVSQQDIAKLKKYLMTMVNNKPGDTAKLAARDIQYKLLQEKTVSLKTSLPKSLNGIEFIPDYKNWQAISTTERFDNGTMRVILGNDIAIAAIKNNQINPWPKGTIFAKVAWDQVVDSAGNITTGAFKQVEYMIKDEAKYTTTHGWGFARFKTPKLVPYGKDAMFVNECITCHKPVSDNDFVFTQPIKH